MEVEKEQNDYVAWELKGRTVERRPRPEIPLLAPTAYSVINRRLTGSTRQLSFDYGATWSAIDQIAPVAIATGPFSGYLFNDSDDLLSRAQNSAINSALAKLRNVQFDLGVFLGELPETLAFVAHGVDETLDGYRDACKRADRADKARARLRKKPPTRSNLKRINNLTNLIASIWLSYRYGVMPLYYALGDALKTFESGLNKPQLLHVQASSKEVVEGVYWNGEAPITQTGSIKCRCSLVANVTPNIGSSLGLDNPALIAWELTPLSFVFDWFINVGEFLTGLAPQGTTFLAGTVSTKVDTQVHRESSEISYLNIKIRNGAVSGYSQSYSRDVLSGLPQPQLYYKPRLNMKRYLDAFALSKSIFAKLDKYAVKN